MKYCLYLFSLICIYSCTQNNSRDKSNLNIPNSSEITVIDTINSIEHLNVEQSIEHLDSMVDNYADSLRYTYPIDSIITKNALLVLRRENMDTLSYFLTRFFIKKYRFHMECCNQGYELRTLNRHNMHVGIDSIVDPLLYEFLLISKSYEPGYSIDKLLNEPFRFMNSGVVIMKWINENPKYLLDSKIKSDYDRIKKVEERIENYLEKN